MANQWQQRQRPVRLERRYGFPDYESLRDFLDRAAEVFEHEDLYPDMGFGRDYVNVTLHVPEGGDALTEQEHRIAQRLDELAAAGGGD
jgi:pterin-4a-carbinolamine dehydratase